VPGHSGFAEHDKVDSAAKRATALPTITDESLIPVSDYRNHYRTLILKKWNTFWNNQHPNKLLVIKKTPCPWTTSDRQARREEVKLTRLRIGHTRITHSFIINPKTLFPPDCLYCHEEDLTE